jgi:hypothetical protein
VVTKRLQQASWLPLLFDCVATIAPGLRGVYLIFKRPATRSCWRWLIYWRRLYQA